MQKVLNIIIEQLEKEKLQMKKTISLILIGILELLIIIIMITFEGTYAKYITNVKGSDSARVAHWNINTTNNIKDLLK